MPDVKFSALPAAATLTGAEIIAIIQAGNAVRGTVSAMQNNALGTYTPPGTGAVATTVAAKLGERESVRDFGADSTGVIDCTAAFTAAGSAFGTGACAIWVPRGTYNGAAGVTPTGRALWIIPGEAQVSGGILTSLGYDSRPPLQFSQTGTTANDLGAVTVRRTTTHTGGGAGNANAGFRVDSFVSAGVTNAEWALVGVMQNSATAGQNVGIFGQGNKLTGAGPTWGGVFEAVDRSGSANPTSALVGGEIDIRANGTDTNIFRVGLDLVVSRPITSGSFTGTACSIAYGYRVGTGFGDIAATVTSAFSVWNGTNVGTAFDCSGSVVSSAALKMPSGAAIAFDAASVNTLSYDGTGLNYKVSGTSVVRFATAGSTIAAPTGAGASALIITPQVGWAGLATGTVVSSGNTLAHANQNVNINQVALQGGSSEIVSMFGSAGTDLKVWSNNADATGYHFRIENDALTLVTDWMTVSRSGTFASGQAAVSFPAALAYSTSVTQASLGVITGGGPGFAFSQPGGGADSKLWDVYCDATTMRWRIINDAQNASTTWLTAVRTGVSSVASTLAGTLGINGASAPAQVTGFGTPTGGGVIANFPGATATLAQTSQSVAQILLMLKAFGLGGA